MKVNIYYNYNEETDSDSVKTLEIPNEIVTTMNNSRKAYKDFLATLDLKDRIRNTDKIKKLYEEYEKSRYRLEDYILENTGLLSYSSDPYGLGYYGIEDVETEEIILEY